MTAPVDTFQHDLVPGEAPTSAADPATLPKLRVGVLVDSLDQAAWVARVLEDVRDSGVAQIVLVVRNGADPVAGAAPAAAPTRRSLATRVAGWWRHRDHLPYTLYRRLDRRRYVTADDPEHMTDVTEMLAGVPVVTVVPRMTKFCDYFEDDAVAEIRRHELDVALRFGFRILKGESLRIARYGVWSYHHGDNRVNRGGPAGFWEVMHGEPVTGAMLQVLTEELDAGLVLRRSFAGTNPVSVTANKRNQYWQATPLVTAALRDLHTRRGALLEEARAAARDWTAYSQPLYVAPGARDMIAMAWGIARRLARRKLESFGRRGQWFLAYRLSKPGTRPPDVPEGAPFRFTELVPPADRFWADPIPAEADGRHYIFFEEYFYGTPRAHISVVEVDARGVAGPPRRVLERPYHLSYPFVFRWNGEWYMIPETLERRAVELYRATRFPDEWAFERTLLADVDAVDATLAEIGGRWWMFFAALPPGTVEATLLHLYHAPTPLGPWTPHRRNPVKADVRDARPAGPLFRHNGAWYRPAQVGVPDYGSAMVVHRIDELSPTAFSETRVAEITPTWQQGLTGTHTIAAAGGLTVIDARRTVRARR